MKFDGAHRAVETLDSAGIRVKTTIDGFGRLKEVEDITPASGTGLKVTNDFTPAGKLISTTTNTSATKFAWDSAGRTIRAVSDPKSGTTTTTISENAYDTVGRLTKSAFGEGSSADANAPLTRTFETTEWKGYGSRLFPGSILSFEGTSSFTHTPTFDALGGLRNLTTAGAPDMSLTQTLDQVGRIKSVTSPEQRGETKFVYERGGLTTNEIQPPGMSGTSSTITNQATFTPADGSVLEQYTDASGQATKTERDGLGRTYRRTYADGTIEEIYYDLDRVIKVVDRQGRSQTFNYDPQTGRLDTVVDAGVVLDDLDYDDRGHLTSWKTPDSVVTFSNFDPEGRPQLTTQTRLDAAGVAIDSYSQNHVYDGFGRRTSWTMPGAGALTTGWTTEVQPQYDGAGNVTRIDRSVSGGTATGTLLNSEYRTTGRPKTRTLSVNPASPTEIRREYDYDASAGRLKTFEVFVNNTLTAGSDVEYEGTLLKSARLLGIANGERTTSWAYDERGRLKASAAASKDPNAATAMAPKTVLPKLNDVDFIEEIAQVGGTGAAKTFGETAAGHKIEHASDPANPFEYRKADGSNGGGVRTRDAHFLYEFDHKERLRRVTQRPYGGEQFILRIVYSYSGLGRMIGRDVLIAPAAGGTTVPNDSAFAPATAQQLGPDAGLPPRTTFVWDPISDQLVSVFDTDSGQPIRQYIHGGMGLDDPIEVAVAESGRVARYYPIYDEAGDGGLQAILSESGKIVTRTIVTDPYGGDQISIAGPAVEKVTVARAGDDGVTIDVAFTEPIDAATLVSGVRLSSLSSANAVVFTSPVAPTLTSEGRTVRWTLTSAEWAALANAPDAHALSVAVTDALRSTAYTPDARVLAADPTLRSGVYATVETPFELRETFALLGSRLATGDTYNGYELTTLTATSAAGGTTRTATTSLGSTISASFADSAASLLLTASFQALPFAEPATGLVYARARWYDAATGSFLSPDPLGYRDSSNLYAFAGGDPVNRRDPTGEFFDAAVAKVAAFAKTPAGGTGAMAAAWLTLWIQAGIKGHETVEAYIAVKDSEADEYAAEARLIDTQTHVAAYKRKRARERASTPQLPQLPGVSPHSQQAQLLPAGSAQQQQATAYHNQSVTAQKRGRPQFLDAVRRGDEFNKLTAFDYPYRELRIEKQSGAGYWVVDGYDPIRGEIISRKNTQFSEVETQTGIKYLRELAAKYPAGARIADVPSTAPELVGTRLTGRQILEVPRQVNGIPRGVLDEAKRLNIEIRDVHGNIYR